MQSGIPVLSDLRRLRMSSEFGVRRSIVRGLEEAPDADDRSFASAECPHTLALGGRGVSCGGNRHGLHPAIAPTVIVALIVWVLARRGRQTASSRKILAIDVGLLFATALYLIVWIAGNISR